MSPTSSTKKEATRKVKIGLIQMFSGESVKDNIRNALKKIDSISKKGAQIILLPELFAGPYFCQSQNKKYFKLAEPIPGQTTEYLQAAAKKNGVVIVTSIYEKAKNGKLYNTCVVIDTDGKLLGTYRKIHIPNDPVNHYDEAFYFAPGDLGVKVFNTKFGKIAPQICYDQWFPESARVAAEKGAEILLYVTAIGWPTSQREKWLNAAENNMWVTTQVSHGIDNNCFVASVNRVKKQDTLNFWGSSFVSDPYGQIIKRGSTNKEEEIIAVCDFKTVPRKKSDWPFLNDCAKVTKIIF